MKIRHFVTKDRGHGLAYYWQPAAELRAAGWLPRRLPLALADAVAEAERLNQAVDAWRRGEISPDSPAIAADRHRRRAVARGSVRALIQDYKASRWWHDLAPRTHKDYGAALDLIDAWAGDMPAAAVTPPAVQAFYGQLARRVEVAGRRRQVIETPAKAAAVIRVLRLLLQVGVRLGYVPTNAATRPGISLVRQREPVLWSPAAVAHMVAVADAMGWRSIGTAIALNEWAGQRMADVISLPPWRAEAGALVLRQGKTGRRVSLPLHLVPHLVERLQAEAARPGTVPSLTHLLLHDRTRQPWRPFTFTHTFAEIRATAAAGLPDANLLAMPECAELLFRELRHTAVTRYHAAGLDALGISAITGHTAESAQNIIKRHYLIQTGAAAETAIRRRLAHEGRE